MCHGSLSLTALTAVLALTAAPAAPRRALTAPAAAAPVLDGRLDDACWRAGGWAGGFVLLNTREQPAEQPTRVKLVHDDSALYLAARLTEPSPAALRARETVVRAGPLRAA